MSSVSFAARGVVPDSLGFGVCSCSCRRYTISSWPSLAAMESAVLLKLVLRLVLISVLSRRRRIISTRSFQAADVNAVQLSSSCELISTSSHFNKRRTISSYP